MEFMKVVSDICGLFVLCAVATCAGNAEDWSFERAMLVSILWFEICNSRNIEEKK